MCMVGRWCSLQLPAGSPGCWLLLANSNILDGAVGSTQSADACAHLHTTRQPLTLNAAGSVAEVPMKGGGKEQAAAPRQTAE